MAVISIDDQMKLDSLTCEVHKSFESLERMAEEWDRFVLEETDDIYLTYAWCRIWWKYYGMNRQLVVLIFRVDGCLVGILPLGIDRIFVGWSVLRVAKLLNSEYTASVLYPAIRKECSDAVFKKCLQVLFQEEECHLFSFGQVVEGFESYSDLVNIIDNDSPNLTLIRNSSSEAHCYIDLPDSIEGYFSSLKSKQRSNVRRRSKLLEERFGPIKSLAFTSAEEIEKEFPVFREMHDRYWMSQGQGGHFVDLLNGEEFTLELVRECAQKGRVCLQKIVSGPKTIGYQFLFYSKGTVHWRLTAREIGDEWGRMGIGVIALLRLIEDSIERKMKTIEAGPGIYEYKTQMGGAYRTMRCLTVGQDTISCRVKIKSLSVIYKGLDILYYKLWYQRLVKILGISRGAIWQYYLRCRL